MDRRHFRAKASSEIEHLNFFSSKWQKRQKTATIFVVSEIVYTLHCKWILGKPGRHDIITLVKIPQKLGNNLQLKINPRKSQENYRVLWKGMKANFSKSYWHVLTVRSLSL